MKILFVALAVFSMTSLFIGVCAGEQGDQEIREKIREQTEKSLPHIIRAEEFVKEKEHQKAIKEYDYILQFYPLSIYAQQSKEAIDELTPRTRPKNIEKQQAIISPSRLSFMPTPDNLKQGVFTITGGTSVLGEFKAGVYDWLEVGLISGILVDVKAKILNEHKLIPAVALGAVAPAWDLELGEIYGVAGKKLGRLNLYAGWSYIAGESAVFGGTKLALSKRSSILLEYNQPIFFDEGDVFELIDFGHNLNTGMAALRFIFPYNIGVETGIGVYTDYWYDYEPFTWQIINIRKNYDYFLRFQLFWSVWL